MRILQCNAAIARILLAAAPALLLSACVSVPEPVSPNDEEAPAGMLATVERQGDRFLATLSFDHRAPIWAFQRSAVRRSDRMSWRPDSWQVLTPGVALERIGDFDALVAANGDIPTEVEIAVVPLGDDLIADYDPAIILSSGAVALYGGHFRTFPATSRDELADLGRPHGYPGEIVFLDADDGVLSGGRRVTSARDAGDAYVLFGSVELVESEHIATMLDPGLPDWLATELREFGQAALAQYEARMGQHGGPRPVFLASWAGATPGLSSLGGSVTAGMIAMRFEGSGLELANPAALDNAQNFIAHEAAHFWLGQAIAYDAREQMWITEGGADYLAIRMQQILAEETGSVEFDAQAKLAALGDECIERLGTDNLSGAASRGQHRAHYACGAQFAYAVEQAGLAHGRTYFDFVRQLIATNPDGEVGSAEWLETARVHGLSEEQAALIETLLHEGVDDPAAILAQLLAG